MNTFFSFLRLGLNTSWLDGEGDSLDLSLDKHKIADKFCDENQATNWNIPIDRLDAGENNAVDVTDYLFEAESAKFREDMYRYGRENLIMLNIYIR